MTAAVGVPHVARKLQSSHPLRGLGGCIRARHNMHEQREERTFASLSLSISSPVAASGAPALSSEGRSKAIEGSEEAAVCGWAAAESQPNPGNFLARHNSASLLPGSGPYMQFLEQAMPSTAKVITWSSGSRVPTHPRYFLRAAPSRGSRAAAAIVMGSLRGRGGGCRLPLSVAGCLSSCCSISAHPPQKWGIGVPRNCRAGGALGCMSVAMRPRPVGPAASCAAAFEQLWVSPGPPHCPRAWALFQPWGGLGQHSRAPGVHP